MAEEGGDASGEEVGAETGTQRRQRIATEQVVDELAVETKRTALLDRVEAQLRGRAHVSRVLLVFTMRDDRKIQTSIEQEFNAWTDQQERSAEDLTGFLLFVKEAGMQLLEGPTDLLFKALEFFNSLSLDIGEDGGRDPRPALIGPLRVLHFTELHGVRASVGCCTYNHTGKIQGAAVPLEDSNCSEMVFGAYRKLLELCCKVRDSVNGDADNARLQSAYRKFQDYMPSPDEVLLFVGKVGVEQFFSYPEFEKVFVAPFNLVLHSELLWPMPPALSY